MSDVTVQTVENDSLVGLMNQLAEVPVPGPVSMAPQTAGWIVVLAFVAVAIAWFGWRVWRQYHANSYRRAATKALALAADDPVAVSAILKRTAMVAYGRRSVAGLSGQAWVTFLESTGSAQFGQTVLAKAVYERGPSQADPQLTAAARTWVKSHRVLEAGDV